MNENYFRVIFIIVENITDFPKPFSIITACNPMDVSLKKSENQKRNEKLKVDLNNAQYFYKPIIGSSPDYSHQELSFTIKCTKKEAIQLGNKFGQRAIFWVTSKKLLVIDCDDQKEYDLGSFEKRIRNLSTDDLSV